MKYELYPHYWVNHLSFLIRKRMAKSMAANGHAISPEEWAILLILNDKGRVTPTELSDVSVRDKTTVTRMLDKLVGKGLVDRSGDPHDRRVQRVQLTPAGRETFEHLAELAGVIVMQSVDGIANEDLDTCVRTLSRMAENLKGKTQDGL